MMRIKGFISPSCLEEALRLHADLSGQALYVAGGTDVLVAARAGRYAEETLIDISRLEELRGIREERGRVVIGALSAHSQVECSPLVRATARMLAEAAGSVGSPQIRNRGTLGGNVSNASPAADTLAPLAALRAVVMLQGLDGEREAPLEAFVLGAYRTALRPGEIVKALAYEKPAAGSSSCYVKLGRRNALAISRLSCAALASFDGDRRVAQLMLSMGSVFASPMALPEQEAMLIGEIPTAERIRQVAEAMGRRMIEAVGYRWSSEYKLPASVAVCEQALTRALLEGRESA